MPPLLLYIILLPTAASAKLLSFDANWLFHRGDSYNFNTTVTTTSPFTSSNFNDSSWDSIDIPHDWSALDLPKRSEDLSTPTLPIRYGAWKFQKGDNVAWSNPSFNDAAWPTVQGGEDWRIHSNYTESNATGWYRQTFDAAGKWQINASTWNPNKLLLSIGVIAGSDETWLNGVKIGTTGNISNPHVTDYVAWRRYVVPSNLLLEKKNVVAIRITSVGGAGQLSRDGTTGFPGGLYDDEINLKDKDVRIGPWDASTSVNGAALGYSVGGVGWYRKHFATTTTMTTKAVITPTFLVFDGVYMNSEIWLNDVHVGGRPYGYTTFVVNVTSALRNDGQDNVLAIKVSNLGQNSRWYSGSGIYRHTWLLVTPSTTYIPVHGVHVTTPSVVLNKPGSATGAVVSIAINLNNEAASNTVVDLLDDLVHPDGTSIVGNGSIRGLVVQPGVGAPPVSINITLDDDAAQGEKNNILLWSADSPSLYSAVVTLQESQASLPSQSSEMIVAFGIRTLQFTATKGFQINGITTKLRGGCVHHANGPLGARTYDRSERRRVEMLKKNGYNAIRTSHNPVSPAFLQACDELGMYVMDEAFDCWNIGKNPNDYSMYFHEWWRRDLEAMVKRDWNHPSIIMWSIGNEIPGRDTANGAHLSHTLANFVRTLDDERAVTSAYPFVLNNADDYLAALDVSGYNYSPDRYVSDHNRMPERIIVGTESFPTASFQVWDLVWTSDWVIGDFIWTALDYIGEAAIGFSTQDGDVDQLIAQENSGARSKPYGFHLSYCGDFDIVGGRKGQGIYRNVLWNVTDIEMVVHRPLAKNVGPVGQLGETVGLWGWPDELESWTWHGFENETLEVRVFTWQCTSVIVELNGVEIDGSPFEVSYGTELMTNFSVQYMPGELHAFCANNNSISKKLVTTGAPAALQVSVDRDHVKNDPNELIYVEVIVLDKEKNHIPEGRVEVTFEVSGATGTLLAVGSGDPTDLTSFQSSTWKTFRGRVVGIVQPTSVGEIVVKVSSLNGVLSKEVKIEVV